MTRLPKITKQMMIDFELEIVSIYEQGKIRAPIHLSKGNEDELIKIFKNIEENDWVFSTHRAHYHSLLKSRNPEWLKKEIVEGRSLHINSKEYKIFTSAIVGGNIPIALGVALAQKIKGQGHTWCFVGDMAAEMGCFNESWKYAVGHNLPITYVIEDNDIAVYTPTKEVWGHSTKFNKLEKVLIHKYKREYPHAGMGKFINF